MKIKKGKKGSVLVFTLVILSMALVTAIAISAVTVIERRSSGSTADSNQAFQIADSGIEVVLNEIYQNNSTTVARLTATSGLSSCTSGKITVPNGGNAYELTFKDDNGADINACDSPVVIASVKSTGFYKQTTRAIEAVVAAGGLIWTDVEYNNGWNNCGNPWNPVQYAFDIRTGMVYLRGFACHAAPNNGNCIFYLPSEVRPPNSVFFPSHAFDGIPEYTIPILIQATGGNAGCVSIYQSGGTVAEFEGIFFSKN